MAPPLVHLSEPLILLANVLTWAVGHGLAGYLAHRLPARRLAHDGPVLRLRRFERSGRWYERIGIRRWKDRLPEAGALFAGGVAKRSLPAGADRWDSLRTFRQETRRAERAHWTSLVVLPSFWIWNPPVGVALMVVYGVVVNAPFIAVQRYNRARIGRILDRRGLPGAGGGAPTHVGDTPPPGVVEPR